MCGAAHGPSVVGVAQSRQPADGAEPAWIVAARQLAREAGRDAVRDERLATAARLRAARRSGATPGDTAGRGVSGGSASRSR